MHPPTVEQLGEALEAPRTEAPALAEDSEALLERVAKLRALAVYLSVHLTPPVVFEE
jgi:hypothetical protein